LGYDIPKLFSEKSLEGTPAPQESNYLPSPPTTPVHKRSVKLDEIFPVETASDADTPFSLPMTDVSSESENSSFDTILDEPINPPTPHIIKTHIPPKPSSRRKSTKLNPPIPEIDESLVSDTSDEISIQSPARPKPKKKAKGRTTNNSLSVALNPTIHQRKKRHHITHVGKICSSYYPSNRKVVPHSPGERYHKGKPYDLILI
jgi:hypothetical protein